MELTAGREGGVRAAFEAWARGGRPVLRHPRARRTWTIMGSGPAEGTYHGRQAYIEAAATALSDRLIAPTASNVRAIWADGDHVIVR